MTGIVLCEINSGLAIEPQQLPDGIVGDDTPVPLYTTGAVGAVTWDAKVLPPGRTLSDNGDGNATISGTFTEAGRQGLRVECADSAGQFAVTATLPGSYADEINVAYPSTMVIAQTGGFSFEVIGGPAESPFTAPPYRVCEFSWRTEPLLPNGVSLNMSPPPPGNRSMMTVSDPTGVLTSGATYTIICETLINGHIPEESLVARAEWVVP